MFLKSEEEHVTLKDAPFCEMSFTHQTKTILRMIYLYKLGNKQRLRIMLPFFLEYTTCFVMISQLHITKYGRLLRNTSSTF
jgi:hypothetical protein